MIDLTFMNFAILVGAYLLGSVPFGLVITKLAGLGDVRAIGSGNIGATNVLRTGRKDLALLTLLLDAGKAGIAVVIAMQLAADDATATAAGMAAFFGHCFPIYLGFKGGKGVATFFGTLFAVHWQLGLITGIIWLLVAAVFRMSSLAGIVSAFAAPIVAFYALGVPGWPFIIGMSVIILVRHKDNIQRIFAGTESKIGGRKSGQTPSDDA